MKTRISWQSQLAIVSAGIVVAVVVAAARAQSVAPPAAGSSSSIPTVSGDNIIGYGAYITAKEAADPELAKLAAADRELARQSQTLIAKYGAARDDKQRSELKQQLLDVLAKQFEVQQKRRETELARVEERVRKVREQLKKRDEARKTIIDRRLEQMISDAEGLGWTPPAGASSAFPSAGANTYSLPGPLEGATEMPGSDLKRDPFRRR